MWVVEDAAALRTGALGANFFPDLSAQCHEVASREGSDGYILITELPKVDIVAFLKQISFPDRHGEFVGRYFLM